MKKKFASELDLARSFPKIVAIYYYSRVIGEEIPTLHLHNLSSLP